MSIKASLSSIGLEEALASPTLKKMYLYNCLTNKDILTKEAEVAEETNGSEKLAWEKYRLKEPIQRDLVEVLLNAGEKYLFRLTPKYEPVLAAIRMSQPEDLVKVHVSNTDTLKDSQLEWLISGGNVNSLDIHGCVSLGKGSLDAINKFGTKLKYLRLGDSSRILPAPAEFNQNETESLGILKTPKLKTFVVSDIKCGSSLGSYWRFLLKDFVSNLEDLRISSSDLETLDFLEPAKNKLSSLTLSNCVVTKNVDAWAPLFKLDKLRFLDLIDSSIGEAFSDGNGENVVQRLRTSLPNLTQLNIDPGLVRKLGAFAFVRRQGRPNPKRLEFLGTVADMDEMRKGTLLANQVAGFGSASGELRALEYYADRLNSGYSNSSLEKLLERLTAEGTSSVPVAGVFMFFMKALKNNGIRIMKPEKCFEILHELLTASDVPVKLGEIVLDQFVDFVGVVLRSLTRDDFSVDYEEGQEEYYSSTGSKVIVYTMGMMLKLDREICCHHYEAVLPTLMKICAENYGSGSWELFYDGVSSKISQLIDTAVERLPELYERNCDIASSVLDLLTKLRDLLLWKHLSDEDDLRDSLSSMISSLRKICLTSGTCRASLHANDGVKTIMDFVRETLKYFPNFNESNCLRMLEILKIVLQDTTLTEVYKMMPSDLEKCLIKLYSHSEWKSWQNYKTNNRKLTWWQYRQDTFYKMMEIIVDLLSYLESDPRFGYDGPAASTREIIAKLK